MKMQVMCVAAVLCAVVGCTQKVDAAINGAKIAASREMKDPASAIFRDVRAYPMGNQAVQAPLIFVCGHVNGKNGFGAYAGESRFFVMMLGEKALSPMLEEQHKTEPSKDFFEKSWAQCKE